MNKLSIGYITYLIYILLYEGMIWGGFFYAVFFLQASVYWWILAVVASAAAYKPSDWHGHASNKDSKSEIGENA